MSDYNAIMVKSISGKTERIIATSSLQKVLLPTIAKINTSNEYILEVIEVFHDALLTRI